MQFYTVWGAYVGLLGLNMVRPMSVLLEPLLVMNLAGLPYLLFIYFNIFTQGSPLSNMLISRGGPGTHGKNISS